MADDEKKPERKKLSLQNSKLSLSVNQENIRSSRVSQQSGVRSVQIETRRKRVPRNQSNKIGQMPTFQSIATKPNLISGLTEHEKATRLKALKLGLQNSENNSKVTTAKENEEKSSSGNENPHEQHVFSNPGRRRR